MPSTQHLLLKQLLTAATGPLAKYRPRLATMRLAVEALSLGQLMPWNVFLTDVNIEGMAAEWVRPAGAPPERVLLYLHGGGYVLGSLNSHRSLVGTLAQRCQLNALAINYRKAPEYPFPAALDDALLAYQWLLGQGHLAQNILVAGDSAGGGLTLALLLALREAGQHMPAAAVGLSPWTDLVLPAPLLRRVAREESQVLEALEIHNWGTMYAHHLPLAHPLVSPVNGELHGLPPLLIQISDAEVLGDDVMRFAAKAQAAGVPITLQVFEGLVHWWHLFWRFVPEARQALDQVAAFSRQVWADQPPTAGAQPAAAA
ncbi:alpha/beta hydrolase [Hymenobacter taeanensis]|uniref:Alpha/beta hydrolase n=1 Tax=Hymenobacter taeanensis TaxID=2735321 RepID=A0A6M6BDQ9_9BACT|nr:MULTISPECIES: alpha/beta hydrolase [Hymenobacter]QJX45423.1 alpha/beta hydrolase [Hymenobacter taeanensis]UOQ81333.1 alpha/beta hydrolase [Hymenobacter sp. 5414T-23]